MVRRVEPHHWDPMQRISHLKRDVVPFVLSQIEQLELHLSNRAASAQVRTESGRDGL